MVAIGLVVFTIVSTIILAFIMYMLPIAIPVIAVCSIFKNTIPLDKWTERFRILGQESAKAGRWENALTPYLIEIMKTIEDMESEIIVLKLASQTGKSELFNNLIAYIIHQKPAPVLSFFPTDEMAKKYSKIRLSRVFENMPFLLKLMRVTKNQNHSSGTDLMKMFRGGYLILAGSNNPSNFSSWPVAWAIIDELDRFNRDVGGEGSAVELVRKRQQTFDNPKTILGSTPTSEDDSQIQEYYEMGSQEQFFVKCPKCKTKILLEITMIIKDEDEVKHQCQSCNYLIPEREKYKMVRNGQWIAKNNNKRIRSFELNALYSLFGTKGTSWETILREYQEALSDEKKRKVFYNTRLALPYGYVVHETVSATDMLSNAQELPKKRETAFTTMAVDVQGNRLELEIFEWGKDFEAMPVLHKKLHGDTKEAIVWTDLFDFLDINKHKVNVVAIDSGYLTNFVYDFIENCMKVRRMNKKFPTVYAVKGSASSDLIIKKATFNYAKGRAKKQQTERIKHLIHIINPDIVKEHIYKTILQSYKYRRGLIEKKPERFYFNWYSKNKEYYKQLCSEVPYIKTRNGITKIQYKKKDENAPNEILDLWCYNFALAIKVIGTKPKSSDFWDILVQKKNN